MAVNRDVRVNYVGKDQTQSAAKSAVAGVQRVKKEVNQLASKFTAAQRTFGALTLGFAGANMVKTLGDMQESMLRVRNMSQDYAKDQQFLSKVTRELNIDLQNAASAYSDILVLQSTGYLTGNQAQSLFIGFQETAKKFGVGAADIQFALRGLRQAMTAGVVRAQEFDQIFDAIGAVTPAVAKHLGVTTQELLKMRSSASLSSDALLNALIPALREADGSAAAASDNINASLLKVSNAYKEALKAFEEPINDGVGAFADTAVAAIDGLVEHSGKIKAIGVAIAAAYGGRAIQSVLEMNAARLKGTYIEFRHSQALAQNTVLIQAEAKAALDLAKAEQAAVIAQRQALQAQLASTASAKARVKVHEQLNLVRQREIAGVKALQAANATLASSTTSVAAAQRAASLSTVALTKATNLLKSSMALVGGPIGLATSALALLVLRARESSKAMREIKTANDQLESRLEVLGSRALQEIAGQREAAEIKLNELVKERAKLLSGETGALGNLTNMSGLVGTQMTNLNAQIRKIETSLKQIKLKEDAFLEAEKAKENLVALDASINALYETGVGNKSKEFSDKFLPDKNKISELKIAIEEARMAFDAEGRDGSAVISAIQAEIDQLTGVTEARQKYAEKVKAARQEIDQLNDSLKTERQRVEDTFRNAQATVELNVELGLIDSSTASTVIARAREAMSAKLKEIDDKDISEQQRFIDEEKRLQDERLAQAHAHRDRMTEALSTVAPNAGEIERYRNHLTDLANEYKRGEIQVRDFHLLIQAAEKEHGERIKAIQEEQLEGQRKRFSELSAFDKVYAVSDVANTFLNAFQKNVGEYVQLNEDMTDAEKKQAIASNAINKKRFEDNKKASIAQAIISTITGATRAFETVPYPLNFAAAAAIAAAGFRNVANIRSSTFGGTAASVSTGGGSSLGSGSTVTETPTETATAQPTVTVHVYPPIGASQDEIDRQVAASIQRSVERDEIVPETQILFNNAA